MKRPQLESSTCSCSLCVRVCIYIYVHASIQTPGASTVQNISKSFKLAPEGLGSPCTTMLQQLKGTTSDIKTGTGVSAWHLA